MARNISPEVAGFVHFIDALNLGFAKSYFGEVPEGFATPSIYYPPPERESLPFSTGSYQVEYALYIKVFDKDSLSSDYLAEQITDAIMTAGRKIPTYDASGVKDGHWFHVNECSARNIETGVTQIYITYKVQRGYYEEPVTPARVIHYAGLPTNVEEDSQNEQQTDE